MKNKITLISLLAGVLLLASSCDDVFDVERVGAITPEQMWGSPELITKYVNNFYGILPAWDRMDIVSAESNPADMTTSSFLKGIMTTTDIYPGSVWDYGTVRTINEFFAKMKGSSASFASGEKERLMGQAYFFRAYHYYRMLQCFGGVPVITNVQNPAADIESLYVKRSSSLETFDFIAGQLDSAIMNLAVRGASGYGAERITKAAAMVMRAKLLLLKASPLFCKTSNSQYWTDAYNAFSAAKTELDTEGYGLYQDGTKKATENMWYKKTEVLKEMVIYIAYNDPLKVNGHQAAQLPLSMSSGATGGQQPTLELVQAYPMKDGKDISESADYDAAMFWKNRDPRFYSTIVFNGAVYGLGSTNRRQWNFQEYTVDGYKATDGTYTGFYCRKGIDTTYVKGSSVKPFQNQAIDWAVIRYPEVLLDLAECANQLDAHRAEAKNLIIPIRQRAGIEAGIGGNYGLAAGVGSDKSVTLKAIMKERQIEFAYEGKRYWDLRRLRMFQELNAMQHLHGMAISLNKAGVMALGLPGITETSSIDAIMNALTTAVNQPGADVNSIIKQVANYTPEIIDNSGSGTIAVPDKYYFYPISPDYILQNPNLEQNTGWENGSFEPTIQ